MRNVLIGWTMLLGINLSMLGVGLGLMGSHWTFPILLPGIALAYWAYHQEPRP